MRVLVTGATGMLGSNLVRLLLERGDRVRALKRPGTPLRSLRGLPIEIVEGSLERPETLGPATRGVEGIYHVAGLVSYWKPNRSRLHAVNVEGTRNLVQAAARNGVRRLVYTGTIGTVGAPADGGLATEDTDWCWDALRIGYWETKRLGELAALEGGELGLEVPVVLPGQVFGPNDVYGNAGRVIEMIMNGVPVPDIGGITTSCGVDDVCRGHVAAMSRGRPGRRYILGGHTMPYRELIDLIGDVVGRRPRVVRLPRAAFAGIAGVLDLVSRVRGNEPRLTPELVRVLALRRRFSSDRAIAELGYRITPLRETIQRAADWYRTNPGSADGPALRQVA